MFRLIFRLLLLLPVLWFCGLLVYGSVISHLDPYEGKAEGIIVLTGGGQRIEKGFGLLRRGQGQRLLISGVHHDVRLRDLISNPVLLQQWRDKIDLGFAAQDTLGNADEAAQWVQKNKFESVIVVTAHYHLPRAMLHLGAQLPDVALYAYPVKPEIFGQTDWWRDPAALRLVASDYSKFLLTYPQILWMRKHA